MANQVCVALQLALIKQSEALPVFVGALEKDLNDRIIEVQDELQYNKAKQKKSLSHRRFNT